MECRDTKLLMDAYWDRHLPPEMADHIESHLRTCAACRTEYGGVNELLARPVPVSVPAGLRDRIMAAIDQAEPPVAAEPAATSTYRWWMELGHRPWMGAAAACLLFFLFGWFSHYFWMNDVPGGISDSAHVVAQPTPITLAAWTQNLTMPGPGASLSAVAQAVALDRAMQPELPVMRVRNRALDQTPPSVDPAAPALEEISRIVAGLSPLGA